MTKEQKFYKALQDVFIGAKIEGQGGFVNLMMIKSSYYSKIEKILKDDIEKALKQYPTFRDELFDKLYTFFNRYFTESGSIYFSSTPFHNNIYEKVYTDDRDVILFWKTQMLYYVKTDRIFKSMPIEFDNYKFYFDATTIENKKANEKRSLIYELKEVKKDKTIVFNVYYSEKGRVTKTEDILKELKKSQISIDEEKLERAFCIFEKQSEVDFFINKNAKAFLQEQFKLWSYQYFWDGAKEWTADRVNELQILKDIAFKIIDFISQFEDELVKIWNKPKFVKNSNYVITLDRINNLELIEKIFNHPNINEQIKEWQELGIVDDTFKVKEVFENDIYGKKLTKKYEHLPIDTKYFKDLELEILSQFEDLDNALDGWLIKSENYQALNTILPKFKEKVQTIYIDPPFNTGDDFEYVDRYQDSSWLSLMNDRIELNQIFLHRQGVFLLHLDEKSNYYGKFLLNNIFDEYINEIIWHYFMGGKTQKGFSKKHDSILIYAKDGSFYFNDKTLESIRYLFDKPSLGSHKDIEELKCNKCGDGQQIWKSKVKKDDVWDISGVFNMAKEFYDFDTQKPESLLRNLIESFSKKGDIVLDNFCGIGTTIAVAHKLNRKWIGIEMGNHVNEFYLNDEKRKIGIKGRMKQVLAGKGKNEPGGISKDINWKGGGFFKYYELEQYEEALANTVYENHDITIIGNKTPYEQYVFLKDEKMLKVLEIDYENNQVKVDLNKLYENIDIAETLSNLTGKWIKKIQEDEVEFEDGTKINTKDLNYKLIKPLIWWE